MIRSFIVILLSYFISFTSFAREVNDKHQATKKAVEDSNPHGHWDLLIMVVSLTIVAIVLFFSIKFLVWPREKNNDHVKNIVTKSNQSHL